MNIIKIGDSKMDIIKIGINFEESFTIERV